MKLTVKQCKVAVAVALGLAAGFATAPLSAETCLSPYIKGLRQPEKVMYLWSLPAVADGGPDFLFCPTSTCGRSVQASNNESPANLPRPWVCRR